MEFIRESGESSGVQLSHPATRRRSVRSTILQLDSTPLRAGWTMGETTRPNLPTVLLVEDDPDTRTYMVTWLEAEGYRVCTAANGREALEILLSEVPSVMLVDLTMPVMDGAELRRHQQEMPSVSRVPFVLVSGTHDAARIAQDLGIRGRGAETVRC